MNARRFKPYPAYKDSGVEWLGEIPAHWKVKRLRFVSEFNPVPSEVRGLPGETDVSFVPMEAVSEHGGLSLETTKQLADVKAGYTYFRDGDIVIAKITPCFENGKGALAAGLTNGIAFGTTELHVLRATERSERRYMFYVTLSDAFRRLGEADMYGAGGQKRVSESFVRNFSPALPSLPEQHAIAAFLDRETARIDALVAKKERLIALLQEQRAALITRAVTKGLDPTVPMKDSGVEWLGEIPAHWEVTPIGRKILLQRGVDITKNEQNEGTVPVVSSGGVSSFHDRALAEAPGVVVGRKGTAGSIHYVEADFWPHDTTLWVREFRGNSQRFVYYKLSTLDLASFDTGTANPTLNRNLIHPLRVSWPPIHEQGNIAAFLDRETARIDALVAKVGDAIERLKELRTAVMSAAVTGKIDVRGASAEASATEAGAA